MPLAKPAWPILQRGDPLSVGLVLAWPLFEGSGNRTQDLSGKNNNGTLQNSPSWGGGPSGSTLSFNGSNQAVVAAKTVDFSGDFSMGGWFLYNIGSGNERSFTGGGDNTPTFWHSVANFGVVHGGTIDWISAFAYSTGVWYRIWLTRKGNTATVYVNGVQKDQNTSFTPTYGSNTPALGGDIGGSFVEYWSGKADDPRIYTRALSASEVAQDYFDSFSIYRPKRRVPWFTAAGGGGATSYSFPTKSWNWNHQAPSQAFSIASSQKSWQWHGQAPSHPALPNCRSEALAMVSASPRAIPRYHPHPEGVAVVS
jgi:hypothetical protein